MYEHMPKLDEIIDFFKTENLYKIDENRILEMYHLLANPNLKLDTNEEFLDYTNQESNVTSIANIIKEVFGYSRFAWTKEEDKVIDTIHQVGAIFIDNQITMKPKIPFYIMVLDKLRD